MACFIVPGIEGLVSLATAKIISSTIKHDLIFGINKNSIVQNLNSLSGYLFGGVILLVIEHIWHGEISFTYPFLTAMKNSESTAIMLHEMSTTGVAMACLVSMFWALTIIIPKILKKKVTE